MPTITLLDPVEMSRLNTQNFNLLVQSLAEVGFDLSATDQQALRQFYDRGTQRLRELPAEQYEDRLSYATGELVNALTYRGAADVLQFGSFRDFLRSFCPLDPFC
jgi:hypothetical protein